jgi:hypothetical protein
MRPAAAVQTEVIAAVAQVLSRAVRGQPARDFTPPDPRLAFSGGQP